jgi:flavin reductase (DIM6/NTAB) family NADH-FMN oxidoreductase RutF
MPKTGNLALVDRFGQVSGRDVDKSQYVESFFGELETAPMIESCPVAIECRVLHEVSVEHRRIFIGAVAQTHVDEGYMTEDGDPKVASLQKLDPILYALDNRYYRVGAVIGEGYKEGRNLQV